jgi:hypothetical protein
VPRSVWWLALLAAALTSLYAGPLRTGFLNDDYLFLEEAQRRPLAESVTSLGPLGNYFRPISRQLYFEALAPLAAERPWVFHAVNYAIFLVALGLLADLLKAVASWPGAMAGTLYFATLPFQRVNLLWISCAQDLLALALALGAVALFRRGRDGWAALAYLVAVFSKESALPLPLGLAAWALWAEGSTARARLPRRLAPFAAVAVLWIGATLWIRARHPAAAPLSFAPDHFLAGYVHGLQSLVGLDHPENLWSRLARHGPQPLALGLLLPLALLFRGTPGPGPERPWRSVGFGLAWFAAFAVVTGPVASSWSSYYYTLAAVGGAVAVATACGRIGPAGWMVLAGGLLWWHAAATQARAFSVEPRPWSWTSHLTPWYFERVNALSDSLGRQLLRIEPRPEPGTRFFFATFPIYAGFQMGNGAQVRALYDDPTIESHFFSQFSESTAADHSCRFVYWDGKALAPLYGPGSDVFFQVGSDLLLFERWAGARHAFRRGLARGENRLDHLYWLGWTELWLGRRDAAERAWIALGARDDPVAWHWHMRIARQALNDERDTLLARRALANAIHAGIGRPEAHAVLGHLLLPSRPKYALLELKVALALKPDDWLARRELVLGLMERRMEEEARIELARLGAVWPEWRSDSLLGRVAEEIERRADADRAVMEF